MFRLIIVFILALFSLPGIAVAQVTAGDDAPLRLGRFEYQDKIWYGFLSYGGMHQLDRSYFDRASRWTGKVIPLEEIRMLVPVRPGKIISIARNYKKQGGKKSKGLKFFTKRSSAVIATGEKIVLAPNSTNLHYEGEMVIVIGDRAKDISAREAENYIFGVTVGNDVTEREHLPEPSDLLAAKGSDTQAPLGPWIVPGLSYDRLGLITRLNGKVVQKTSTRRMVFSVGEIVAILSRHMTLEPGDVIYTGTPGKTRALKPGDKIEISLEGVGVLKNTVAE
ncbi:Fumarylacetoacetate hydrolase family protein [hydrothermal vent metagenome]|uniref:Fumarylacetoacetate hydrolase family protein n=1 Tax=hydrothermal vent metagenome TaxID=652676 RepID=A0A3B0SGK7_9ZZZZ